MSLFGALILASVASTIAILSMTVVGISVLGKAMERVRPVTNAVAGEGCLQEATSREHEALAARLEAVRDHEGLQRMDSGSTLVDI